VLNISTMTAWERHRRPKNGFLTIWGLCQAAWKGRRVQNGVSSADSSDEGWGKKSGVRESTCEYVMSAAEEYRRIAEQFVRLAREAKTEEERKAFLDMQRLQRILECV
jgi:hypothetical protein